MFPISDRVASGRRIGRSGNGEMCSGSSIIGARCKRGGGAF